MPGFAKIISESRFPDNGCFRLIEWGESRPGRHIPSSVDCVSPVELSHSDPMPDAMRIFKSSAVRMNFPVHANVSQEAVTNPRYISE